LFYGGWGDYQQWADHDFRPRASFPDLDESVSGVLPVTATPPTPAMLPIGPRSVLPASRKSTPKRKKKDLLPLAAPPTPAPEPEPLISPLADTGPWSAAKEPPPPAAEVSNPKQMVRPYTRTGGRTRSAYRLELETLLSTPLGREREMVGLPADHRAICLTCRMPQSTAEVAARLGLPLGAARVLIADVVDLGLLTVHPTSVDKPSMDLLYRVASGLRNL
jgi:hypothetical protein